MRQIITTRELAELTFAKQYNDISDDIIKWFYDNVQDVYESLHIGEIAHEYDGIVEHRTEYDCNDVFFSQLDYLYEFYDATHKIFDF